MNVQSAADYLREFSSHLLSSAATDQKGNSLDLNTAVQKAVQMILARRASNKILSVGNGGSAAIVGHAHNDFSKMVGIKSLVFHEISLLTALSNDDGYDVAFEKPVRQWAQAGDLLIAVSSSGRSQNILRAVRAAQEASCEVITFSGFKPDNPLRTMGQINFYVASDSYGYVEASHMVLLHLLTDHCAATMKSA